jgi:hypothetical protein
MVPSLGTGPAVSRTAGPRQSSGKLKKLNFVKEIGVNSAGEHQAMDRRLAIVARTRSIAPRAARRLRSPLVAYARIGAACEQVIRPLVRASAEKSAGCARASLGEGTQR